MTPKSDIEPLEYSRERRPRFPRRLAKWMIGLAIAAAGSVLLVVAVLSLPLLDAYVEYRKLHRAVLNRPQTPGSIVFELHRGEAEPRPPQRAVEWDKLMWHLGSGLSYRAMVYCGPGIDAADDRIVVLAVNARQESAQVTRVMLHGGRFNVRSYWKQQWSIDNSFWLSFVIEAEWQRMQIEAATADQTDANHFSFRIFFDDQSRTFDVWFPKDDLFLPVRVEERQPDGTTLPVIPR